MKIIKDNQILDITPEMIAKMFCNLDSSEQARFFNHIDEIASKWKRTFEFQLQGITEDDGLTLAGRRVMQSIGEYSHWGLVCKLEDVAMGERFSDLEKQVKT